MFSRVYPILDSSTMPPVAEARRPWLRNVAQELIAAGISILQYRNKSGNEAEILGDAEVLRGAVPVGKCILILNDYAGLVARASFDGVHVGQMDIYADEARALIGPERMLGISTHNVEQLIAAEGTSADYVAVGPVFATASKANPDPVVGLEGVRVARSLTKKPLVAIGGITIENFRSVIEAGADSVAVISALFRDMRSRSPDEVIRSVLTLMG